MFHLDENNLIYLVLIAAYFLFVWVGLRLAVPYLGFGKTPLPTVLPKELEETIVRLNAEAKTDREYLERAYSYVTTKYVGGRLQTVTQFWRAFGSVFNKSPGFLPCNMQNHLLRTMLVKSGRFTEDDIQIKTVPLNLFIHQYLSVRVAGQWTDVDPWSHFLGLPIGKKKAYIG